MSNDLNIAVAGASGALGTEIIRVLDRSPWRPDTLIPLASATSTVSHVDYGEERIAVDVLDDQSFEDVDALIIALPTEVAGRAAERALEADCQVVDCSGFFADDEDVPLVVPWVNPEALQDVHRGVVRVPSGPALLLASALGPLARAGVTGLTDATVLVPASYFGKSGIDELSRQVVALLNSGTPPRKVFEHGLAFDLIPQVGSATETGWTHEETAVSTELARILGADVTVDLVGVPIFSGMSAQVVLAAEKSVPVELLLRILGDGGVQLPADVGNRYIPRPRRVEGHPFVHAGRVRLDPAGRIHMWLSMDNLRAAATTAVGCCGALVK